MQFEAEIRMENEGLKLGKIEAESFADAEEKAKKEHLEKNEEIVVIRRA